MSVSARSLNTEAQIVIDHSTKTPSKKSALPGVETTSATPPPRTLVSQPRIPAAVPQKMPGSAAVASSSSVNKPVSRVNLAQTATTSGTVTVIEPKVKNGIPVITPLPEIYVHIEPTHMPSSELEDIDLSSSFCVSALKIVDQPTIGVSNSFSFIDRQPTIKKRKKKTVATAARIPSPRPLIPPQKKAKVVTPQAADEEFIKCQAIFCKQVFQV
jgi:hypothetical protein